MPNKPANKMLAETSVIDSGDTSFMIFATTLVFLQTPGIGLTQAGLIRRKNSISILMQIFTGTLIGSLLWYLIGFSLTFGDSIMGGIIGDPFEFAFFHNVSTDRTLWPHHTISVLIFGSFQLMFAIMAPLVISGCWVEKMRFESFLVFVFLWPILIYYPVVHWVWHEKGGFLYRWGVLDFAGGLTINTTTGVSAFLISLKLKKRLNFYDDNQKNHHNLPLTIIGASICWAGWYSFNAGSAYSANSSASVAVFNTHMAACVGSLVWIYLEYKRTRLYSIIGLLNGAFSGLAAISSGSSYVPIYLSPIFGLVGGVSSFYGANWLRIRQIDDVLQVSVLNGIPGIIGTWMVALFANSPGIYGSIYCSEEDAYYGYNADTGGSSSSESSSSSPISTAVINNLGSTADSVANAVSNSAESVTRRVPHKYRDCVTISYIQLVGIMVVVAWTSVMTWVIMKLILKITPPDIDVYTELKGLDLIQIGEIAYQKEENYMHLSYKMYDACKSGNYATVLALITEGVHINSCDYDKRSPLHIACYNNFTNIVGLLLKSKAEVNCEDRWMARPIDETTSKQIVDLLLSFGSKPRNSNQTYNLLKSAADGDHDKVLALLDSRISPDAVDYDQRTALHLAVCNQQDQIIQLLCESKANPLLKDRWGNSAVNECKKYYTDSATQKGVLMLLMKNVTLLEKGKAIKDEDGLQAEKETGLVSVLGKHFKSIMGRHRHHQRKVAPAMYRIGSSLDLSVISDEECSKCDSKQTGSICSTSESGSVMSGEVCSESSAIIPSNIGEGDENGDACKDDKHKKKRNSSKECKNSIANGDASGAVGMHAADKRRAFAIASKGQSVSKLFGLRKNSKSSSAGGGTDGEGASASSYLGDIESQNSSSNHSNSKEQLPGMLGPGDASALKMDFNVEDVRRGKMKRNNKILKDFCPELFEACAANKIEEVKLLLSKGYDINSADYDKRTLLHIACSFGYTELVTWLVEFRRIVDHRGKHRHHRDGKHNHHINHLRGGSQNWSHSVRMGSKDLDSHRGHEIRLDVNAVDVKGNTALYDAVKSKNTEIISFLEAHGAINVNGISGSKLCEYAANGDLDSLQQMRDNGEEMSVGDYDRRTALHLACCNGHVQIVKWLVDTALVNMHVRDRWGSTPLQEAIKTGNREIIEHLRSHGATE